MRTQDYQFVISHINKYIKRRSYKILKELVQYIILVILHAFILALKTGPTWVIGGQMANFWPGTFISSIYCRAWLAQFGTTQFGSPVHAV